MGCTGSTRKTKVNSEEETLRHNDKTSIAVDKPVLTEELILNLLEKTKFKRQDILDWWCGFLADCPTGLLDKKKFIEVYQFRYPNGKAKRFCDHVFRTFKPDKKTNMINFERFICAIDVTLNGNTTEKLEWAFIMYDVNGDDRISKKEMIDVVESMFDLLAKDKKGKNDPRKHVERIFERLDLNHDNYVSKEEFINGCKADEQIRTILAPNY